MPHTLSTLAAYLENTDPRFSCTADETRNQIYLTSSSRPDVPDGISMLPLYYQIRLLKGKLNDDDAFELARDAVCFADRSFL